MNWLVGPLTVTWASASAGKYPNSLEKKVCGFQLPESIFFSQKESKRVSLEIEIFAAKGSHVKIILHYSVPPD